MTETVPLDRDELARRIARIEADVYRNADRTDVDDMALLKTALHGMGIDLNDVVVLMDENGAPVRPLEESVASRTEMLEDKADLAECASAFIPPLREHGYDSLALDRMSDDEICRTFRDEVEKMQANES